MSRATVDLPQPDSPTTPSTPPSGTLKLTLSTATTVRLPALKVLATLRTSIAVMPATGTGTHAPRRRYGAG